MMRKIVAWSLLAFSALGGLWSVYWLLFAVWMTAHPRYDSSFWRTRVYELFAIAVADGLLWIGSIIWLFRMWGADARR